ncbi:MAG: glycosyltransferase family 2 protein [Planctomycetota bacterium]|nr:glycosyltransferase family 2 protein [Planctomycetota bacterium]
MDNLAPDPKPVVGLEALTPLSADSARRNGTHPHTSRPVTVAAVIPCFNRRDDLTLLLRDVARLDLRGIDLWCVVVDNASTEPLSTIRVPPGLRVEFVRSPRNTGGSGGFNLGMSHVLSGAGESGRYGQPDYVWWLDSDARVGRSCLRELVRVLKRRPRVGAVGSGLRDIDTGHTWEVGGRISRVHGGVMPAAGGDLDKRLLCRCDYLAACSALVRRSAIERTGLFPDNFIYYDDVDWCIQMTRATGYTVLGAPKSRAFHPPGNRRYVTWARYYIARNAFSHMDVMGMGGYRRFRRAWREVPRAIGQAMMGAPELAALHLRGLRDARDRRFPALEPRELPTGITMIPFAKLRETIDAELGAWRANGRPGTLYVHPALRYPIPGLDGFRQELKKVQFAWPRRRWRASHEGAGLRDLLLGVWRTLVGPSADVAITTTGWPTNWSRGRTVIKVTTDGLIVKRLERPRVVRDALRTFARGLTLSVQLGLRGPHIMPLPPAPRYVPAPTHEAEPAHAVS